MISVNRSKQRQQTLTQIAIQCGRYGVPLPNLRDSIPLFCTDVTVRFLGPTCVFSYLKRRWCTELAVLTPSLMMMPNTDLINTTKSSFVGV